MNSLLRRGDYEVRDVERRDALPLVVAHHYARGAANTATFLHGLFRRSDGALVGVAWWMPPTKVAAASVAGVDGFRRVLSLSRLVILPDEPQNAASFLIGRSIRRIAQDGRFDWLVTYADERMGHTGAIYRATNWQFVGRTRPEEVFVDAEGRQVSRKATRTRTRAEMRALGHRSLGRSTKLKFVYRLGRAGLAQR